jgi:hypothetical protein
MNPAEDVVLFASEITEGMWVLPESEESRWGRSEDAQLRGQRFRRVTRMQPPDPEGSRYFIGEWADGYREGGSCGPFGTWIVKKDSLPGAPAEGATP